MPFHFIANDGNLVVNPIKLSELDEQGVGERYDIVVDFRTFKPGDSIYLANLLKQTTGASRTAPVSVGQALAGDADDPCVGPILEFRVVNEVQSVDAPGQVYTSTAPDQSTNFADIELDVGVKTLTRQIPVVAPVRVREIEYGRPAAATRAAPTANASPIARRDMPFPWSIKVNGQAAHTLNANRISALIPKPGEVEHWTLNNGGGGWDHPIHLHFEEGVTIDRADNPIPSTERLVRKDVWRLRPGGGSRCRSDSVSSAAPTSTIATTPPTRTSRCSCACRSSPRIPTRAGRRRSTSSPRRRSRHANGVLWKDPEILPEGDPRTRTVAGNSGSG